MLMLCKRIVYIVEISVVISSMTGKYVILLKRMSTECNFTFNPVHSGKRFVVLL